jgi:hypothetical protein
MPTALNPLEQFPPQHEPTVRVQPPLVYVEPAWEYKHLTRSMTEQDPLSETELNTLGNDAWELAGVFTDGRSVHFYFKRQTK